MIIQQRRVRRLERHVTGLIPHTSLRVVVDLAHVNASRLERSGFNGLQDGDQLLPTIVGTVTRFNAEGRFQVHRDQPKESRFVGRRTWTRHQWAGRGETTIVTEETDVYRDCYPRTPIPAPGVELTLLEHDGKRFAVSPTLEWGVTPEDDVLHVINLFLELFREAEVRHDDLQAFTPPNTCRVNWSMLPAGPQALGAVTAHVAPLIGRLAESFRGPVNSRLTVMASLNPDPVYVGVGGFNGYVAYVFSPKGKVILESIYPGNATYVFDSNWPSIAQLNKQEVLAGRHNIDRIFHTEGWEAKVRAHVR